MSMKRLIAVAVWLFHVFFLAAQADFTKVDEFARNYKTKTTDANKLAKDLTSQFDSELLKVRSIFIWITENIQYDIKEFRKISKGGGRESYRIKAGSEKELAEKKKQIEEEKHRESIKNTLSKRKGVCQDYAELFNEMCKSIGIKSGMIDGSTKDITGQYWPDNHAWNWVEIKGKTYLLDATWASGSVDYSKGKFTKEFNDGFFLTPPAMFVVNHFPNDSRWQLLNDKVSVETFKGFPAVGQGFFKYKVKSFSPKEFKIAAKGRKIGLSMKFGQKPQKIWISHNGQAIKEVKKVDDDFSVSVELKKNKGDIEVWGDNDLIVSYKTK